MWRLTLSALVQLKLNVLKWNIDSNLGWKHILKSQVDSYNKIGVFDEVWKNKF